MESKLRFRIYFRDSNTWFRPVSRSWIFYYEYEAITRDSIDGKLYKVFSL